VRRDDASDTIAAKAVRATSTCLKRTFAFQVFSGMLEPVFTGNPTRVASQPKHLTRRYERVDPTPAMATPATDRAEGGDYRSVGDGDDADTCRWRTQNSSDRLP
jgi:hypothetical protein